MNFDGTGLESLPLFESTDVDYISIYRTPADESPLAGWTIYLDDNHNGQRDVSERYTVTNASGNYSFSNLAPGPLCNLRSKNLRL